MIYQLKFSVNHRRYCIYQSKLIMKKGKKTKMKTKKNFFRETHKVSKGVVNMRKVSPGNQIN